MRPGYYQNGDVYTDEEKEFLVAVEAWMKKTGCKFPRFTDVLGIVKSLGYRKAAEEEPK